MTPQAWVTAALTLLSVAASAIALGAVRTWAGSTRRNVAVWLRARWRQFSAWLGFPRSVTVHAGTGTGTFAFSGSASGYTIPAQLAKDLSSYTAHVDQELASLGTEARAQAKRVTDLEAAVATAARRAEERDEDAALAERWVLVSATFALLATLVQIAG